MLPPLDFLYIGLAKRICYRDLLSSVKVKLFVV